MVAPFSIVLTRRSLHGTLFCRRDRWIWNVEWRSDMALSVSLLSFVLFWSPTVGFDFSRHSCLLYGQHGASHYDHLIAVPIYPSRYLCVSAPPPRKCNWNVVWSGLPGGVTWPANHTSCILLYGCYSYDVRYPALEDDVCKDEASIKLGRMKLNTKSE